MYVFILGPFFLLISVEATRAEDRVTHIVREMVGCVYEVSVHAVKLRLLAEQIM